jgi:hypothetical protein
MIMLHLPNHFFVCIPSSPPDGYQLSEPFPTELVMDYLCDISLTNNALVVPLRSWAEMKHLTDIELQHK